MKKWLCRSAEWLEGLRLNFFEASIADTMNYLKRVNRK